MNRVSENITLSGEDALVVKMQGGDIQAFEPLVEHHLPHIRAFLALRVPAAHLVDELAHETFVYAFRHIHEFTAGTVFSKWLRSIAWNLLRAELQRFSREQANQARYAHAHRLDLLQAGDAEAVPREADLLRDCINQLPDNLRELVSLKYQAEQSSEAIAERLKRSTAWVWTTLFRVRQQLKDCIEGKLKQAC